MPTFEIVPAAARVELDPRTRAGRAAFQVRNTTARGLLAQTHIRPGPATPGEWLTVEGEATRSYPAGGQLDVGVAIKAPEAAAPATYTFHVEVVGLDNPDEDLGRSPDVSFLVPRVGTGYLATFAGAVAGGVVGVVAGLLPVTLAVLVALSQFTSVSGDFGTVLGHIIGQFVLLLIITVVFGFIGVFGGLWIGPVVGSVIGLRLRAFDGAAMTAGFLAIFQPVWSLLMIVAVFLLDRVVTGTGGRVVVLVALLVVALALPPWPARWLTLRLRAGRRPR